MHRFIVTLVALLLALPASAQDGASGDGAAGAGDAASGGTRLIDANALREIEDIDVMNADGEEIGEIEEVLIDGSGKIVAVTIEVGGFLDIGDEELVVALDNLVWREDGYALDLSPDEMQGLPRFD